MGSLSISVIERTKEIGVMRAIGAGSGNILSIFIIEGVVQGLISWGIAVPLSMLLAPALANAMGMAMFKAQMDFQYNYGAIWIWLVVILAVAVLASMIPSYSATQVNVRQSITYE
jgi:putative ABC transport system permease protein